jgi:hypothetical protein
MTRGYETRFCSPQSEIWTCGTGPYRGRFWALWLLHCAITT